MKRTNGDKLCTKDGLTEIQGPACRVVCVCVCLRERKAVWVRVGVASMPVCTRAGACVALLSGARRQDQSTAVENVMFSSHSSLAFVPKARSGSRPEGSREKRIAVSRRCSGIQRA